MPYGSLMTAASSGLVRVLWASLVVILLVSCSGLPFLGKPAHVDAEPEDAPAVTAVAAESPPSVGDVAEPEAAKPPRMEVTRTRVVPGDVSSDTARRTDWATDDPTSADSTRLLDAVSQPQLQDAPVLPEGLLVGLASDRVAVKIDCCGEPVRLFNQAVQHELESTAVISAWSSDGSGKAAPSLFFLQAAALKDQQQATALAARLGEALGTQASAVFDAQTDLYKVRVGPTRDRQSAEQLKPRLEQLGYRDPWIVREANAASSVGFVAAVNVDEEARTVRFEGRHLLVESPSSTVRFGGVTYRGRLLLFVNDRAQINVINAVDFEDYLRGVVPKELGPALYPELEALKAQAIAARTYTLKNMGEFLAEGYDICSTPRCQVYGGMSAEHPLSDRAIKETEGEVLVATAQASEAVTEIVDAMFSASCGGHTENVSSVFPLKGEFYLRARPCVEGGLDTLTTQSQNRAQLSLADAVVGALASADKSSAGRREGDAKAQFQLDLLALADAAQIVPPKDRLRSFAAKETRRYLASTFDLFLDRQWFEPSSAAHQAALANTDRADLARAFAELAVLAPSARVEEPLRGALVMGLAKALGLVDFSKARVLGADGNGSSLQVAEQELNLQSTVPLFLEVSGTMQPRTNLATFPGDPLRVVTVKGQTVAIISDSAGHGRSPILAKPWNRFRSRERLQALVSERYPGFELADLEIISRGDSSRVERLDLVASDGRRESVQGLEVRWVLDLPDTWFTAERSSRNGAQGWSFSGRGRGHGVGMCQVGAYGMAVMGVGYEDILEHYYSGASVVDATVGPARFPWAETN